MGTFENMLREDNSLDSFLIDGVDPVAPGLEGVTMVDTDDEYTLTPADESAIFLETLACGCDTPQEFYDIIEENAVALEMYGVIENASAALEAVKRMKVDNWKQVNLSRVSGNQSIRMAQAANSSDYKKYKKYRALYIKYKKKIEKRYEGRAKVAARRAIQNSQRKVSAIKDKKVAGGINKKLDKTINGLNKDGRNGVAIKENGK